MTLVDRQNFHLFQPLAYQVATGALSAVEIASPLRQILRRQKNANVLLAEVTGFDLERRAVRLDELPNGEGGTDCRTTCSWWPGLRVFVLRPRRLGARMRPS